MSNKDNLTLEQRRILHHNKVDERRAELELLSPEEREARREAARERLRARHRKVHDNWPKDKEFPTVLAESPSTILRIYKGSKEKIVANSEAPEEIERLKETVKWCEAYLTSRNVPFE